MVEIFYTSRFGREAKKAPKRLQPLIEERILIFQNDPFDSRLKTHKLTGPLRGFWSFSVNYKVRIIFEFISKQQALFHSIGDHSIYD